MTNLHTPHARPHARSATGPRGATFGVLLRVALVVAVVASLFVTAPADADGRYDHFSVDGWWNVPSHGMVGEERWSYPDFPIACNTNPDDSAFQALWIYPEGTQPWVQRAWRVKGTLHRAASIFAASAHSIITDDASLRTSLSPRFVTKPSCEPTLTDVPIPAAVAEVRPWEPGGLFEYLATHGFNQWNRKYIAFQQGGHTWDHFTGWAQVKTSYATPGVTNPANYSSFMWLYAEPFMFSQLHGRVGSAIVRSTAHEMTHSMGAETAEGPHLNQANYWHVTDCGDVLCYIGNDSQVGQVQVCPGRFNYRLDCNADDYFAPGAEWTTRRWAVSSSAYLWGNPQPSAPPARTGATRTVLTP